MLLKHLVIIQYHFALVFNTLTHLSICEYLFKIFTGYNSKFPERSYIMLQRKKTKSIHYDVLNYGAQSGLSLRFQVAG